MSVEDIKHRARSVLLGDGKLMGDFYCDKETDEFIEHAPADIEFLLAENQRLVEALEIIADREYYDEKYPMKVASEALQAYKLLEKDL